MTPEGKLETYLRRAVKQAGGQIRKTRWIGRRGCPDDFIWFTFPRVAFVEVKADGKDLDPRSQQAHEIRSMHADGLPVFVVSSTHEIDEVIRLVKNNLHTGLDLRL